MVANKGGGTYMTYTQFVIRIILALVLGSVIGLERQLTGHRAGIRINVLICMGTCLFLLFPMMYQTEEVYRIASYIVSGVGFLCSGVIFKEQGQVSGINTAATLWCTAAIGILASTGKFVFAITATAILVISNLVLRPIAIKIPPIVESDEQEKRYRISVVCSENAEIEVRSMLLNSNNCKTLFLSNLESSDVIGEKVEIYADFCSFGKCKNTVMEQIVRKMLTHNAVTGAGWEIIS